MSRVNHFEAVIEAVCDNGRRVRLDGGAVSMSADCGLCGRPIVDADGNYSYTLAARDGVLFLRCMLPRGCGS